MRLSTFIGVRIAAMLLALVGVIAAGGASAHSVRTGGSTAGIAIPSLSHGEMAVISPYHGAIMDLALSASDTNEPFRRLLNFAQIQYVYCLWGVMPGSVSDEQSPFNECSHAYLAATKAVLLAMRSMPDEAERAGAIVSQIDIDMVQNSLSFVLCQFSAESFNTADIIRPFWTGVPFHAPTAAASLGFLAALSAGVWGGMRLLRTRPMA